MLTARPPDLQPNAQAGLYTLSNIVIRVYETDSFTSRNHTSLQVDISTLEHALQ